MNQKNIENLLGRVESELLRRVRRPARYIGGEINQVKKDWSACDLTFALCFPDVYEVGMSHTGLAVLYEILNSQDGVLAERVFAPWGDAEQVMRKQKLPLFSLESKKALSQFDIVGFSLNAELCYTNVLNMLDLGGLAVRSADRLETDPLIIAGGGMANSCEPMAPFVDAFVLGDGEESLVELVTHVRKARDAGQTKRAMLLDAARKYAWVYVPALYEVIYDGEVMTSIRALEEGVAVQRSNAVVKDYESTPACMRPIVPFIEAVHERVSVEIMRGCPGRCRFCQVSFCKRPIRYRSVEKIFEIAKAAYEASGFDTVSLLSLSSAEYPDLEALLTRLHGYFKEKRVGLSVPSLRVDRQLKLLPQLLTSVRKGGLTIAVEAASERLRLLMNKPLSDEDLFAAVEAAYAAGWQRVKLYFMVGLPSETEADIRRIVTLAKDLGRMRKRVAGSTAQINAAISWLVPKAHTPLGWLGQKPQAYFDWAKTIILEEKRAQKAGFVMFKFHDTRGSILESAIGRGNRRMAEVIETVWRAGARFDLWDECFYFDLWCQAFKTCGMDLEGAAAYEFDAQACLPWEHLGGPDKQYVLNHYYETQKMMAEASDMVESERE
ncbi:MAG: TIGR03960 family B12-binding radical SAM protein [Phycisphaerae bacterium]|nr:TIGR03960 family B12-binding radical SAM protein [Phycisphaerae bacterium]